MYGLLAPATALIYFIWKIRVCMRAGGFNLAIRTCTPFVLRDLGAIANGPSILAYAQFLNVDVCMYFTCATLNLNFINRVIHLVY
jgi:hypothetical protein